MLTRRTLLIIAADVASESPVLLSIASAEASVTQAKTSALGIETLAACS